MSEVDAEVVEQAQKQEIASSVITLWELQLKDNEYVHFHFQYKLLLCPNDSPINFNKLFCSVF